jgi:hypothetical protein
VVGVLSRVPPAVAPAVCVPVTRVRGGSTVVFVLVACALTTSILVAMLAVPTVAGLVVTAT